MSVIYHRHDENLTKSTTKGAFLSNGHFIYLFIYFRVTVLWSREALQVQLFLWAYIGMTDI